MSTRRTAKASRAIREVVSKAILFEMNDPRVKDVTVLDVEVAPDMRSAKVFISVMGDATKQGLTLHGLNSARGFLQRRIADEIDTRYTPILSFVMDDGVKKSIQAAQILQKIADERSEADSQTDDLQNDEDSSEASDSPDPDTEDRSPEEFS